MPHQEPITLACIIELNSIIHNLQTTQLVVIHRKPDVATKEDIDGLYEAQTRAGRTRKCGEELERVLWSLYDEIDYLKAFEKHLGKIRLPRNAPPEQQSWETCQQIGEALIYCWTTADHELGYTPETRPVVITASDAVARRVSHINVPAEFQQNTLSTDAEEVYKRHTLPVEIRLCKHLRDNSIWYGVQHTVIVTALTALAVATIFSFVAHSLGSRRPRVKVLKSQGSF
ncbi:P-loop containing nucleoside triphosphate hydrolase protein [Pseudohyphozyma bogoriensis]|nr:P-loop containing nucleoside triphosphate hydrolase protein [Pseudohyphozyma bogoriensis]